MINFNIKIKLVKSELTLITLIQLKLISFNDISIDINWTVININIKIRLI